MGPIYISILLLASLSAFAYVMYDRLHPLLAGKADSTRLQGIPRRVRDLLVYGFLQKRMVDDPIPGLLHIFIFGGFVVVGARTMTMVGMGFNEHFALPGMHGRVADTYLFIKDALNAFIVLGCVGFLYRRWVTHPKRLTLSAEGWAILLWISSLVFTDLLFDGADITLHGTPYHHHPPFVHLFVMAMQPLSIGTLQIIRTAAYWYHVTAILTFLVYLPHGKHFHVILALPNILLRRETAKGQLAKMDLDPEKMTESTVFGMLKPTDMSWKQMLDVYTCTECGRCTNACPAFNSGKPLSPKQISINLRNTIREGKMEEKLPGGVIDTEVLWSCTTCRACEEMCPVFIEYVDRIVDMRRELVMMEGSFPTEVQNAFTGIERNGNPWNFSSDDRMAWTEGLNIRTMAQVAESNDTIDYLFWVGCSGSFDDRNKKVSRALVTLLNEAGVKFAILGKEESCTGDPARRIGNEMLYQAQAATNVATFQKYAGKIKKVVTACPHCFNTIKNEYPDFGLKDVEMIHHSMLLDDLVKSGKLKVPAEQVAAAAADGGAPRGKNGLTVFHDPCYLGRYNDQYDAPRAVLDAVPGMQRTDVEASQRFGRCCGAGGGRMFMEEKIGTRMNEERLKQLKAVNPDTIAVGCPFCMTMVNDAVRQDAGEKAPTIQVKDISEVLAERFARA